jgi:hypothetical protein
VVADARRALFASLFDHAALFPPASMDLPDALAEDRAARESSSAWIVARFVCPARLVDELPEAMPPLAVVVDGEPAPLPRRAELVEARLPEPGPAPSAILSRVNALRGLADGAVPVLELVLGPGWRNDVPAVIGSVGMVGGRVKLRCGGGEAPSAEQVALVLAACAQGGVSLKATAGLHHPLPGPDEHGFVNLLAAAAVAHAYGPPASELEAILAERSPDAFPLTAEGLAVHDRTLTADQLEAARRELLTSIGSCSWREPVEGLEELGMLPA